MRPPGLRFFEATVTCGAQRYRRNVWACDPAQAAQVIRAWPSVFGLPHERVRVETVVEVVLIPEMPHAA